MIQCDTVCCSVLQCVAAHSSVLHSTVQQYIPCTAMGHCPPFFWLFFGFFLACHNVCVCVYVSVHIYLYDSIYTQTYRHTMIDTDSDTDTQSDSDTDRHTFVQILGAKTEGRVEERMRAFICVS